MDDNFTFCFRVRFAESIPIAFRGRLAKPGVWHAGLQGLSLDGCAVKRGEVAARIRAGEEALRGGGSRASEQQPATNPGSGLWRFGRAFSGLVVLIDLVALVGESAVRRRGARLGEEQE